MFLVYEKNYLTGADVDCVEESDMQLFMTKEAAVNEIQCRMERYTSDPYTMFTFMKEESSDTCFVIADQLTPGTDDREGEFHICMAELPVTQEYSLYTWDGVEKEAHIMTIKEAVERAMLLDCEVHDIYGNILFSKWDGWNGDYPAVESIWFPVIMKLKEQIFAGLCSGIVKIINNPNDDCIACQIGDNWFYFIDDEYEDMTADEVYQTFTKEELAKMIYEQLLDMKKLPDVFNDEVEYYENYLEENLTSDINTTKLTELMDARNKLCAFCQNKEFCEKCQVTRLIDDAYTEYGEE